MVTRRGTANADVFVLAARLDGPDVRRRVLGKSLKNRFFAFVLGTQVSSFRF